MVDLVTGDTGSKLTVNCKNKAGDAIVLTGSTVRLYWMDVAGNLVTRVMAIDNALTGVVSYIFAATEIFAPKMIFEVEITDSSGKIVTCLDKITLTSREQIG